MLLKDEPKEKQNISKESRNGKYNNIESRYKTCSKIKLNGETSSKKSVLPSSSFEYFMMDNQETLKTY